MAAPSTAAFGEKLSQSCGNAIEKKQNVNHSGKGILPQKTAADISASQQGKQPKLDVQATPQGQGEQEQKLEKLAVESLPLLETRNETLVHAAMVECGNRENAILESILESFGEDSLPFFDVDDALLPETKAQLSDMMDCDYGADLSLTDYHGDFLNTLPAEAFIDHGVPSEPEQPHDILEELRQVFNPSAGQGQNDVERNNPKDNSNSVVDTRPQQ